MLKAFIDLGEHCPKFLRSQLESIINFSLQVNSVLPTLGLINSPVVSVWCGCFLCLSCNYVVVVCCFIFFCCGYVGDGDERHGGQLETACFRIACYHSGECSTNDEKILEPYAKDRYTHMPHTYTRYVYMHTYIHRYIRCICIYTHIHDTLSLMQEFKIIKCL